MTPYPMCKVNFTVKVTLSLRMPLGPMTLLKMCWPTCASTADRGSSSRYTSAFLWTARAKLTLCFCPPDKFKPWKGSFRFISRDVYYIQMHAPWWLVSWMLIDPIETIWIMWLFIKCEGLTFSPISVASPAGRLSRSGSRAQASSTRLYQLFFFPVQTECCPADWHFGSKLAGERRQWSPIQTEVKKCWTENQL